MRLIFPRINDPTVISHLFAYSSRWRPKPWQGLFVHVNINVFIQWHMLPGYVWAACGFPRMFWKSSLYMSTSSLFLIPRIHTEFLVIIFDRAENRSSTLVWETRGDCCLKSLKEEQIILYSQHLPKKNFSLIASRKEKKYMKFVKMTFSCGNYNIFTFFSGCLPETRTKDHIREARTIENGRLFSNSKQNIYVWNLKLQDYREEHKSYLQGVFQLVTWRFG